MIINGFVPSQKVFDFNINNNQSVKNNNLSTFSGILEEKLNSLNNKELKADALVDKMVKGENVNIHNVMLSSEEAKLSLQFAVQVRNKLLEAYQEINRMQL